MPISIVEDTQKSLVIEFGEEIDRSIAESIKEKLLAMSDVEFASVEKEHPQTGKLRLVVKAGKNPKALVSKAIDEILEDVEQLKGQLPKK
ncbi:MAG: RpoL/Rpb11 RNA polymerase subunit family protein [Candidatus Micrarchaeia archaeon]